MTTHRLFVRVYYEDTDLAGVVYYANYLKFFERGRTEALRDAGVSQGRLKAETGIVFVVVRAAVDYLRPAVLDDLLTVETAVTKAGGASVVMAQRALRGEEALAVAEVRLAAMGPDGRPVRLPEAARAALESLAAESGPIRAV